MSSLCFDPELELTKEDRNMGITVKIKILQEDEPRTNPFKLYGFK